MPWVCPNLAVHSLNVAVLDGRCHTTELIQPLLSGLRVRATSKTTSREPENAHSVSPLLRLPVELLHDVLQNMTNLGDLCAVRDTGRWLRDIVPLPSFRSVQLQRTLRDANALGRIMCAPELCLPVTSISFDYNATDGEDEKYSYRKPGRFVVPSVLEPDVLLQAWISAFLQLRRAPSLHTLHLRFNNIVDTQPMINADELVTYPVQFQHRLLTTIARCAPSTVSALFLENISPITHSVYHSRAFADLIDQLTVFSLTTASLSCNNKRCLAFSNALADFWFTTIPKVLSRARNLESLTLRSGGCEEGFVPIEAGIRGIRLPRLRTLRLQNISFGLGLKSTTECRLEDFILCHRDTLECLDVSGSFLWTMREVPCLTWAQMFDRFAAQLPCLTHFVSHLCRSSHIPPADPLVADWSTNPPQKGGGGFGYSRGGIPSSILQEDEAALRRLTAVIQNRGRST